VIIPPGNLRLVPLALKRLVNAVTGN